MKQTCWVIEIYIMILLLRITATLLGLKSHVTARYPLPANIADSHHINNSTINRIKRMKMKLEVSCLKIDFNSYKFECHQNEILDDHTG